MSKKLDQSATMDLSEFKMSAELSRDKRRERERKKNEKTNNNKSMTSLDLSRTFCENVDKLSASPGSIKLTDFGKKHANAVAPKVSPPKKVSLNRSAVFSGEQYSSSATKASTASNKRLSALQNEYKRPISMISSPSIAFEEEREKRASPVKDNVFESSEKKKPKIDEDRCEQLKTSNKEKKKETEIKSSDEEEEEEINVVEEVEPPKQKQQQQSKPIEKVAVKKVDNIMAPFKPFVCKAAELDDAWIKRLKQEQDNLRAAVNSLKIINNKIVEFRQKLSADSTSKTSTTTRPNNSN